MLRRDYLRVSRLFKLHTRKTQSWLKEVYEKVKEKGIEVSPPPEVDAHELKDEGEDDEGEDIVKPPIKEDETIDLDKIEEELKIGNFSKDESLDEA